MIHHKADPFSMVAHFWQSGTPQFIVPMVRHCPELVAAIPNVFDPNSCSTSGLSLRVIISLDAIKDMMCCPFFKETKVFLDATMEEY